jgi:hypothetical protein
MIYLVNLTYYAEKEATHSGKAASVWCFTK